MKKAPNAGARVGRKRKRHCVPHTETRGKASPTAVLDAQWDRLTPGQRSLGKSLSWLGEGFNKELSVSLTRTTGAQALECYSCVQKADDGCSPHKMKTVKCGPGVEVCTEAVGAVETSKCHPVVPDYPPLSDSSSVAPPS